MEEQAAKFVVRQFMEMLGISGLEDEVDGAKEFLDGDEEDEDEDHSDDDEDEDEEGEEEDWDSDEDETQRFVRVFLHIPAEGEPCTGIVRATVEAIPYEDGSERKLPPPRRHDKRPPTKSTKKAIMGCIGSIVDDLEAGWDPEAPVEEHQEEEDLSKDTDDAEVQIYKLLAFLQSRMEARGLAIGRLQVHPSGFHPPHCCHCSRDPPANANPGTPPPTALGDA